MSTLAPDVCFTSDPWASLGRARPIMTLLLAVPGDGNSLLVASDGMVFWPDHRSHTLASAGTYKLHKLNNQSIVWGWQGSSEVGDPFGEWITGIDVNSWDALLDSVGLKLVELNNAHPNNDPTSALLAGNIGTDRRAVAIGPTGNSRFGDSAGIFHGFGDAAARLGWLTALRYGSGPVEGRLIDYLEFIFGLRVIDGIGPPVNLWRITPDECVRVLPVAPGSM